MSYMGRGITRCAAVCLRHLAYEMSANLHSQVTPATHAAAFCAFVMLVVFALFIES